MGPAVPTASLIGSFYSGGGGHRSRVSRQHCGTTERLGGYGAVDLEMNDGSVGFSGLL